MARRTRTKQGMSLHIGLNSVDPKHYQGWDGKLAACEFDAKDMQAIAKKRGFKTRIVLTKRATYEGVRCEIEAAAHALGPGDTFFLTYSGHGGQLKDTNGDETEDKKDETWVLFDREIVDDELYAMWGKFQAGVRILVLSDSCHSGSATRMMEYRTLADTPRFARGFANPASPRFRAMPDDVADNTYKAHQKLYDKVQRDNPSGERVAVGATVLLISGCQDNQLSSDGDRNGLFTATLRKVWANGAFTRGYRAFHKEITRQMPLYQTPNYFRVGASNPLFEREQPFSV